jgi:hypothetical protein
MYFDALEPIHCCYSCSPSDERSKRTLSNHIAERRGPIGFFRIRLSCVHRRDQWSSKPASIRRFIQPVFHFFPGDRGTLAARDFQNAKLTLRIQ